MRKKALTAIEVSVVTSLPQANLVREVKKGAKKSATGQTDELQKMMTGMRKYKVNMDADTQTREVCHDLQ